MNKCRIGILGSGNMGRTLGLRWMEEGYQVLFGSVSPHSLALVTQQSAGVRTGTLDEAAAFGDVLLYTVRGVAPSQLLDAALLDGKVLIDLNNFDIPAGHAYAAVRYSLAEQTQRAVPGVRVVKAFNTLAMEVFELPAATLQAQGTATYLAGDDADAKRQVAALARALGLSPIDAGPLRQARLIESMGDFIRLLMGGSAALGPMAHLSVQVLPATHQARLGGRQASALAS